MNKIFNVKLSKTGKGVLISFKYDSKILSEVKSIYGASWRPTDKAWYFSLTDTNVKKLKDLFDRYSVEFEGEAEKYFSNSQVVFKKVKISFDSEYVESYEGFEGYMLKTKDSCKIDGRVFGLCKDAGLYRNTDGDYTFWAISNENFQAVVDTLKANNYVCRLMQN